MNRQQITAIIVDDEPLARNIIREYLNSYPDITIVQECSNARDGFECIQAHDPDLLFLDIQMPEINGFELIDMLEKLPHIIFSTAYDQYAIKAFEVNAVDYLLKPYDQERFSKAVDRAISQITQAIPPEQQLKSLLTDFQRQDNYIRRLLVKQTGQIVILACHEILWIEAMDDYIRIHAKSDSYLVQMSMAELEARLDPQQFLRAHRSYIINLDAISRIDVPAKQRRQLVLTNGVKIPLSRTGVTKLKRFSL